MTNTAQKTANKTFEDEAVEIAHKRFIRALGNGVTMTQEAFVIFTDTVETRDTTNIVRLIEDCKAKSDNNAARTLLKIAEMVWPECEFIKASKDKDGNKLPARIKIKGIKADKKVMSHFKDVVDAKLSMRGSAILGKLANKPELSEEEKKKVNREKAFTTCDKLGAFGFKHGMTLTEVLARVETAYKEAKKEAAAK